MAALRDFEYHTLTSPAGRFFFSKEVILSQAKLIRDAITAQVMNPNPALPNIRTETDAQQYILNNISGPASQANFSVALAG